MSRPDSNPPRVDGRRPEAGRRVAARVARLLRGGLVPRHIPSRHVRPLRLELEGAVIRDWSLRDRADLAEFADDRAIWRNMGELFPHPYTEADAQWWLARTVAMPEPTHWAIEVDGRAAGGIGIEPGEGIHEGTAQLGYWLGEPFWGRGIVTAAVRALVPVVLSRFALRRLEARVFEWNPASARVLEKAGFRREGLLRASAIKDGLVVGQLVYGYLADGDESEPGRR